MPERNKTGVPGKGAALVGERKQSGASEPSAVAGGEGYGASADVIKRLEHEIGRYRKKVDDDAKEIERLKERLEQACKGNQETQAMVDSLLTAVTLQYGEDATDPDDERKVLGKRLAIPRFNFLEMRRRYEIHARKDKETDAYILGVVEREEQNGR